MDRTTAGDRALAAAPPDVESEAIEFVRFCHRRRRVGWPELYDEMCAVAGRGLYRGYGADDLASIGIGLAPRPRLASTASTSNANRTTTSPTRRARMRRGAGGAVTTPAIADGRASAGVTRSG